MIAQALLTTFITFLGMGLNYLFHFFMTRALDPKFYGELSLLLGLLSVLFIPLSSFQSLLAREIAKLDKKRLEKRIVGIVKRYARVAFVFGLLVGASLFFFSHHISNLFGASYLSLPLKFIAISVPFISLLPILRAYYQGKENFLAFCNISLIEPLLKLILGIILVLMGLGLDGAVLAIVLPHFFLLSFFFPLISRKGIEAKLSLSKSYIFMASTLAIHTAFLYLDLFFVRYYLGAEQAGYYNVAAITSRVLIYMMGGIAVVFYPKTSKLSVKKDKAEIRKLMLKSMLLASPVFLGFLFFPREILTLFYSERYLAALKSFTILNVGMFTLAAFNLSLNFFWSQNYEKVPFVLSFLVFLIDALLLNYLVPLKGIEGAALATSISSFLLFSSSLLLIRKMLF